MDKSKIVEFIRSLKDDPSEVEPCVDLLYELQRRRGPLSETVTLLKYEKPMLHSLLRKRLRNNRALSLVLELSMEYEAAKSSLGG